MKYREVNLKWAKLHLIKTDKFKSIEINIILKDNIKKEDITKRNMLTDLLTYSTKKYPTKRELALKMQDLYSAYVSMSNTRWGNYLATKVSLSLLNPKYTEEGMLEESIKLLHEILFNPNINNLRFEQTGFSVIKHELMSEIKTIKENPKQYANIRMFENMDKSRPYRYHMYGYIEDLETINENNLYTYYKEWLSKSLVDIYVIGDFDEDNILSLVKENLDFKTFKKDKKDLYLKHDSIRTRSKNVIEIEHNNQSKLSIGCKLSNLNDFERKYVINLYNMILGGGFNSKLMKNIREKNSLAYYINSSVNKADNMLVIQSGISAKNFRKVVSSVKKILKEMIKGNISDDEIDNAKLEYLSILDESMDNMSGIINNYIFKDLLDLDDFDKRKEQIKKVTKEDIANVAKKVYLDTVFLLKGDINEEN